MNLICLVYMNTMRQMYPDSNKESGLPAGSEHVEDELAVITDELLLAEEGQSGLKGRTQNEPHRLEQGEQGDVGGPLRLVGGLGQVGPTGRVDA